jgi:hypothetical protein
MSLRTATDSEISPFHVSAKGVEALLVASSGMVGIGTTNPAQKLEVVGNILASGIISGTSFRGGLGSISAPTFSFTNDPNTGIFSPSADILGFVTSGTEQMTILSNGNVGIGTANPGGILDVRGTSSITNDNFKGIWARPVQSSANSGALYSIYSTPQYSASAGNTLNRLHGVLSNPANVNTGTITNAFGLFSRIDNISTGTITNSYGLYLGAPLFNNGTMTNKFALVTEANAGNVGIGTTSPTVALQVVGDITSSGIISGTGSGLTNLNASNISSGTIPAASVVGVYPNITGVGTLSSLNVTGAITSGDITSSNIISGTSFRGGLGSISAPTFSFTNDSNTGIFSRTDILGLVTSGTEQMTILSNGNVGIGTTNPGVKLEVASSDPITLRLGRISASSNSGTIAFANSNGNQGFMGVMSNSRIGFSSNQDLASGNRTFFVLDTSNDRVGIGTTAPIRQFSVGSDANDIFTELYTSGTSVSILASESNAWKDTDLAFYTTKTTGGNNFGERMRITSQGNVGIGTTSPTEKLFVKTGTNRNFFIRDFSSTIQIGGVTDGSADYTTNFRIDAYNLLLNATTNGNVGIGTTTPRSKLEVFNSATSQIILSTGNAQASYRDWAFNVGGDVAGGLSIQVGSSAGTSPVATVNTKMFISSAGNVGIGTVSPSSQLDIFGTTAGLQLSYDANDYGRFTVASDGALTLSGVSGGGALTNIARYSTSQINMDVPTSFNSAGDVSMAYDLYLSNQTASAIKSDGPLTIQSGEAFENLNLTLKASGQGNLIVQSKNIWADGTNVGIGTTAPSAFLNIRANGYQNLIGLGGSQVDNIGYFSFWSNSSPNQQLTIGGLDGIRFLTGPHTSPTEMMRLSGSGNVGIGTTNPTLAKLDVNQSSGISPGSAIKFGAQGFLVSPSTIISHNGYWTGSAWANVSNATSAYLDLNGDIALRTAVATAGAPNWETRLTILNSNGNVGIGTANPGARLELQASAATGDLFKIRNSSGVEVITIDNSSGIVTPKLDLISAFGSTVRLHTNGNSYLAGGRLGIGTTNPGRTLHVAGSARITSSIEVTDDRTLCTAIASGDIELKVGACGTSSIRYKENVKNLSYGLSEIKQLRSVVFNYKNFDHNTFEGRTKNRIGFIAEEMVNVIPEVVIWNEENQIDGIDYAFLTSVLTKGIQEQQLQIEAQSSALQALDPKILDLENTLAQIELERATAVSQEEGGTAFENLYSIVEDTVSRVVSLENSVAEILSRIDSLVAPQISASDSARIEDLSQRMSFVEAMFMGELSTGLNSTASAQLAMSISENEIIFDRKVVAEGNLSVLGETNLGDVGVTGNITNNMLVINGFDESLATPGASLNTLAGALNIQSSGLNSINFVDGSFKMDTDGNFIIHKGNLEVSMGSVKGNDGIRGINVSVGQSQVEMRVNFKAKNDTENYAVGISPSWFTNFLVSGKDENGFTVKFSTPAPQGAKFDWIVIE